MKFSFSRKRFSGIFGMGGKEFDIEEYRKQAVKFSLPGKYFSKIFGIGYNKTGTTTLEFLFDALGYRVPLQQEQELRIVNQYRKGNFQPFIEFVSKYDAFQDQPFSQEQAYVVADALFPNSKFVLTTRDPEKWFKSMCNFHQKIYHADSMSEFKESFYKDKELYLYPNYIYENKKRMISKVVDGKPVQDWSLLYDKDYYIDKFVRRNDEIIRYFQDRSDDLLVIDFEKEKDCSKILEFLDLPQQLNIPLPQLNKSS
jgi:hypothetical protein